MTLAESWTQKYTRLRNAEGAQAPDPTSMEELALAAFLTGRDEEGYGSYEQAYKLNLDEKHFARAVRCAFWLGLTLMHSGQKARAGGWIATAQRILRQMDVIESAEYGFLLIPQAVGALYAGHADRALQLFAEAEKTGSTFQETDLLALARLGQGQASIALDDTTSGMRFFDELMVLIGTEHLHPVVAGIVYCAVIETCHHIWDVHRAREWTSALSRWCDQFPDVIPFRGQCLVRRAEVIQLYGEWERAIGEAHDACTLLTRPPGEPAAGEAFYRQGELFRLRGAFDQAEQAFHEAAKRGRKPQPGLALLRLAQNQPEVAEISIRNALNETIQTHARVHLLPAVVRIMTGCGRYDIARAAIAELYGIATTLDTPYLHAIAGHCQGALSLADRQYDSAISVLQQALARWNVLHLPYETAQSKELKGLAFRELNDRDNAHAEFAAALRIYEQLEAQPDVDRLKRLMHRQDRPEGQKLTLREVQVLRFVANGKTNKEIAGILFISERTVDRHVSNIFNKLGVSSRTEAATVALRKGLLDFGT